MFVYKAKTRKFSEFPSTLGRNAIIPIIMIKPVAYFREDFEVFRT